MSTNGDGFVGLVARMRVTQKHWFKYRDLHSLETAQRSSARSIVGLITQPGSRPSRASSTGRKGGTSDEHSRGTQVR